MKAVKKCETAVSLDGPEVCRNICVPGRLRLDPPHCFRGRQEGLIRDIRTHHEVFYVSRGHIIMRNPQNGEYFELTEGDVILVEEGEPHEMTNIGMEPAIISWSCAPSHI